MNPNQLAVEIKTKLDAATEHFKTELSKIRTGRAHPSMLDGLSVEVYGQQMPLKAVAGITAPEAQLLQITPFDPTNMKAISEAIRANEALGFNPVDDGRIVRIQIPPLTSESRAAMVKVLGQKLEDCLISVRNIRHDVFHKAEDAEKDKQISKDERLRFEKQVDELVSAQKAEAEALAKAKEQEIMTV
jgi:ribosome recycling factor